MKPPGGAAPENRILTCRYMLRVVFCMLDRTHNQLKHTEKAPVKTKLFPIKLQKLHYFFIQRLELYFFLDIDGYNLKNLLFTMSEYN